MYVTERGLPLTDPNYPNTRVDYTHCCGTLEAHGISACTTAEQMVKNIILSYWDVRARNGGHRNIASLLKGYKTPFPIFSASHIIFYQAMNPKEDNPRAYGEELLSYLHEHDLGVVVRGMPQVNPNSGNTITPFIWALHPDTLLKWELTQKVLPRE